MFPDHIVWLEDGKNLKVLKRHLKTAYDLTPEQYRERWDPSRDSPMVVPNYVGTRSALAKSIGLGRKPAGAVSAANGKTGAAPEDCLIACLRKVREGIFGRDRRRGRVDILMMP